jgi:hypothetical protein
MKMYCIKWKAEDMCRLLLKTQTTLLEEAPALRELIFIYILAEPVQNRWHVEAILNVRADETIEPTQISVVSVVFEIGTREG